MIKQFLLSLLAALVFCASANAQSSPSAPSSASSSTQAGASAGPANVETQSAAAVSEGAAGSRQKDPRQKGQGHEASGSAVASGAASGSASANAGSDAIQLEDNTDVRAVLTNSLDSRKCKPGDQVTAKVTDDVKENGQVVVHKGTHLMGHVTQAESKAKGQSESSLGIEFDHARMKNGQEVPLQLGVQALAAAETASTAALDNDAFPSAGTMGAASGGARGGGGLVGGAGSTVAGTAGAATGAAASVGRAAGSVDSTASAATRATSSVAGQTGGLNAAGQLTSSSSGVFGLQGLSLASNLSNATQGSVISSTGKSVQLSSGTQMLLHAAK